MADEPIKITRYPNRRFYDHSASSYVSLEDLERLIREGKAIEVRDSQSGEDLTRVVLGRIIMERQPEKMQLFPVDMLHFMVRSNTVMSDFLRDYFRHALPYLDYLQRHSAAAVSTLVQPMHWIKAWLDSIVPHKANGIEASAAKREVPRNPEELVDRVAQLEQRLRELEFEKSAGGARGS